ncbi:MAG TPA: chromosome segregation protein SMC [Vicinamibacterales bacterium]|jgi:chromosome segregation protein
MRLQKLQISGFKSFSDRSELAFDRGVTAIVGPNGCGKSNVADAIVWVLGEQSAKSLRGDQMQDVIFNGSEARKATGAAEVRLMLSGVTSSTKTPAETDSEDSDAVIARDVEVTRRLYRSGESEYLINGEIVRLKDVHELLMDTGLGAKAYAIIEQGKIGQILSSRPGDRRQLIEEAAGVTKYKARRRAAELKLEASEQNLTRIDDIIFEVEKQRAALKRQAAKARRYKRLREELRRWEKVLFARRYRVLAASIESTRQRLAERRAEEAAAAGRLSAAEESLARTRLDLAQAESHANALREEAHARELEIDRRQNHVSFSEQQLVGLEARSTEIADELKALEARHEPATAALADRRLSAARAAEDRDQAAAVLAAEQAAYEAAHQGLQVLESEVEERRQEVYQALSTINSLQHAIDNAVAARERVVDELARLDAEKADVEVEDGRVQAERAAASAQLSEAQIALERTRADGEARQAELSDAREQHEQRRLEIRANEQELASVEARLGSLEELEAARAQYGDAARFILADQTAGIRQMGSVADYLEVERGHERAVETFLADLLQHVVVADHQEAERGLALVREHNAGRCGFLVASGTVAAASPVAGPPVPGLVSLASVVRIAGDHAAQIQRAIGHAWIAPSFALATTAAPLTDAPVVTPEGDVLHGAHLVYGGAREESRGILSTKREIKELRDRTAALRETLERLAGETAAVAATIEHLSQQIAGLTAEAHGREKAIVGFEGLLAKATENRERLMRKAEVLATESARADEERRSLESREAEARASIARQHETWQAADERLAQAQRQYQDARDAAEVSSRRAADARASHAGLVERATALLVEVARQEEVLAELEARAGARHEEARQNTSRQEDLRQAIADGKRQLDLDLQDLERLRGEVHQADDRLSALREGADGQEAAIRDARHQVDAVRTEVGELDVVRVTAESDLAHLASTCVEAVQATLDQVLAEVEEAERAGQVAPGRAMADEPDEEAGDEEGEFPSAPAVEGAEGGAEAVGELPPLMAAAAAAKQPPATPEEAITDLKTKIDRLGPVNMMAIEQFDELETRHGFLTVQRKDLRESIAATGEAIRRIDETSKERFRDAFAVINQNFQETFAVLFGGGSAGLSLLDETDVLESGIEIVAQPPGKRLQSVQLLSGGEKALTAIALMFGIFRYKPSPFCVLDEIDAPLDDANIGRFIEILKQMQEQTQFIIITHSRKTMEIADRLYGVTMEEPGVSKLISVKLN